MRSYDTVIVGGGFAGAATAWALMRRGAGRVLLIEQEREFGVHASGRNAGMIRQATEEPDIAPLAREGARAIRELGVPFDQTGSLLLGSERLPESVRRQTQHQMLDPVEVARRFPATAGIPFEEALFTETDGVVEVQPFLNRLLDEFRSAGGDVWQARRLQSVGVARDRVASVTIDGDRIPCATIVMAAGAWAKPLGDAAGVPIALEARRRHICVSTPLSPSMPSSWVWDLHREYYYRPLQGELLWSACDSSVEPAGDSQPEADPFGAVLDKVTPLMPRVKDLHCLRAWAGQRSFVPDGNFLLGPDPRLRGWHWSVALGGHGVTVALAVGERVAATVSGSGSNDIEPAHRFRSCVLPDADAR